MQESSFEDVAAARMGVEEPVEGGLDSVVFMRRDSFRMQVVGANDSDADVGDGIPAFVNELPASRTERMFGWQPSQALLQAAAPISFEREASGAIVSGVPAAAFISRLRMVAICASAFACGIIVSAGVGKWRARHAPASAAYQLVAAPAAVVVRPAPPVPETPATAMPPAAAPLAEAPVKVAPPVAVEQPAVPAAPGGTPAATVSSATVDQAAVPAAVPAAAARAPEVPAAPAAAAPAPQPAEASAAVAEPTAKAATAAGTAVAAEEDDHPIERREEISAGTNPSSRDSSRDVREARSVPPVSPKLQSLHAAAASRPKGTPAKRVSDRERAPAEASARAPARRAGDSTQARPVVKWVDPFVDDASERTGRRPGTRPAERFVDPFAD